MVYLLIVEKTLGLRILRILAAIRTYVSAVLYTMVGCVCPVELRMTKRVVFFFPYNILLFVVVYLLEKTLGSSIIYWPQ